MFHKGPDFAAFVNLFDAAHEHFPMRILGFCLLPNHFHLVLWPRADGDISRWMQWVQTTHVRRYHEHYRTSGHVWQGRFKAFPIQENEHLLTVLRYVERNPLRAGLVTEVNAWPWSSLAVQSRLEAPVWYSNGPVPRPRDWLTWVAHPQTDMELLALRRSAQRGVPYETNPKLEIQMLETTSAWIIRDLNLFRISCFGFAVGCTEGVPYRAGGLSGEPSAARPTS